MAGEQDEPNGPAPLWHQGEEDRSEGHGPESASSGANDAPVRVCRKCSTQANTDGTHCPYCGASYARGARRLGTGIRRALVALVLLLILGGGGAGVVLKLQHDSDVQKARDARHARLVAERKRKQAAEEAKRRRAEQAARDKAAMDQIERELRRELERGLRKEITKSARDAVATGVLDGPIIRTSCDPVAGGAASLDEPTGRYECLAVNQENPDGTSEGYRYTGTINYKKGSYSWRLGSA